MDDDSLKSIRPEVPGIQPASSEDEAFFHEVMRPVLKMLHRVVMDVVRSRVKMADGFEGSQAEAEAWVRKAILQQPMLMAELTGVFEAWLTVTERAYFGRERKILGKKLRNLLLHRIVDGVLNPANG